ncbi:MAG: arginyltransferase [Asticcacaulis sp.]
MSQPFITRKLRFHFTVPGPCPYLPDRVERKLFTYLPLSEAAQVNDALTHAGFRRSQTIAYRPACATCQACRSARIIAAEFVPGRTHRRVLARNADLQRNLVEAEATREHYDLLQRYLKARHPDGGMSDMGWADLVAMIEDTTVRTHLIEYRRPPSDDGPGDLVACVLVDVLGDGLSMVYSFYDPTLSDRSLGTFIILDHINQARSAGFPYVYLGYWVRGSVKMDYKARFQPLELLGGDGWVPFEQLAEAPTEADPPPTLFLA